MAASTRLRSSRGDARKLSSDSVRLEGLDVSAFVIPTVSPTSDGTAKWNSTCLVVVEPQAGGIRGFGFTYADTATALLIRDVLAQAVTGSDVMSIPSCWRQMAVAVRNHGRPGVCSMAISAVDTALWDLKCRLLGVPLVTLLGSARDEAPIYGSGGFTSYSIKQLCEQLGGWAQAGIPRVKMKIGRQPKDDVSRVKAVRDAIGPDCQLFVDANGAYRRKQALAMADAFAELGVSWFEEPVSADDLEGLRLLRDRGPAGMEIAAGEYGYDLFYFRRMLEAEAVDVLQADATRCGGITGFLQVAALCEARSLPLSAHCAPALHMHLCCALNCVCHLEYFYDHVRIGGMLFDGEPEPKNGVLRPDLTRPGLGLELRRSDAERYAVPLGH